MLNQTAERQPTYEELQEENESLREQNQKLWLELKKLKNHVFGQRSETRRQFDERQGVLFDAEHSEPDVEEDEEEVEVAAHKRRGRGRKPLPEDLPRERIEYEPEQQSCSCCGEQLQKIGEEVTEELDYIPARFVIREHVKIKRACSKCKNGVQTGKLPAGVPIIEKGRPGPGLVAQIIVGKYCDHHPLNRQEQIFLRHGVEVRRQRMDDWIADVSEQFLIPIAKAQKKLILCADYIRADETGLKVQTPEKNGKLHSGYLWGMISPERDVYFEYSPSRAGKVAEQLFEGYTGFIQTDLYAGYNPVFLPEQVTRVGCWDHVRRKYIEAEAVSGKECSTVLKLIAKLYKIEKEIKKLSVEKRKDTRQEKSKGITEQLKKYLQNTQLRVLPKTDLAKAIEYTLCQWNALTLFLEHGELELSNIAIEQQMRHIAVGRHNWLFAGSERGARWAAAIFSLICTCKINKINPFDYFSDILRRVHTHPNSRIHELTPREWQTQFAKN